MSLEDFNRGYREAQFGRPAQNVSEYLGQQAYYEATKQRPSGPAGTWIPHAKTEPPRWLVEHAFKRGLAFYLGSKLAFLVLLLSTGGTRSGLLEIAGIVCSFLEIAGIIMMIFGLLNFLTRKRRGAQKPGTG